MPDTHDSDIAAMKLSDVEKNGMQVYRNYSRAFEKDRAKRFAESVPAKPQALADLSTILKPVAEEEPRTLSVPSKSFSG